MFRKKKILDSEKGKYFLARSCFTAKSFKACGNSNKKRVEWWFLGARDVGNREMLVKGTNL